MRIATLALAVALVVPVTAAAQPSLLEQAEQLAEDVVLPAPTHQRSMLRTSIGLGMVGTGVAMMLFESSTENLTKVDPWSFIDDLLTDESNWIIDDHGDLDDMLLFDDFGFDDDLFSDGRNPWLRYGGAALAIGGAAISTFWSDVPVLRNMQVTPTRRGAAVGGSVGF